MKNQISSNNEACHRVRQAQNEYINYLEGLLADQESKADRLGYAIARQSEREIQIFCIEKLAKLMYESGFYAVIGHFDVSQDQFIELAGDAILNGNESIFEDYREAQG